MHDRLFQSGRRHQRLQLVRVVDHHEHAGAGIARLLEPAREQRDVQAYQQIRRLDGFQRALAAADRLHADLSPGRHRVHAHLIGVGAEILGRRERGGNVIAPRTEIAEQHHGLAPAHVAQLELLAEQHRQLGVVEGFVHDANSEMSPSP